jgi:hypothetical protein
VYKLPSRSNNFSPEATVYFHYVVAPSSQLSPGNPMTSLIWSGGVRIILLLRPRSGSPVSVLTLSLSMVQLNNDDVRQVHIVGTPRVRRKTNQHPREPTSQVTTLFQILWTRQQPRTHRLALVASHMAALYDGMGSDMHMPDGCGAYLQVRAQRKCHDR